MLTRAEKLNIALDSDQSTVAFKTGYGSTDDKARPRVCILARVSSAKQEKEGTIDAQLKQCHELLLRYFPTNSEYLVHISKNEGLNLETKDERFDFFDVLRKVQRGEINHIICVSLDRLFRGANKVLNAEISQIFTNHRMTLITSDGIKKYNPTDVTGQLLDSVQETLGPIEKKNLVRKLQKARRHHLTENKQWRMAVVPFGYAVTSSGSGRQKQYVYSIVESEAEIVRDIFRMYCDEDTKVVPASGQKTPGVKVIANHLNRLGISKDSWLSRVPDGHQAKTSSKAWNGVFINRILTNPIYRGDLIVCFNKPADNASYEADAIAQKITVPPIVSIDLWDSVRSVRESKSSAIQQNFQKSAQSLNWLHGLIHCPVCEKALGGYTSRKKERYYMCRNKRSDEREHPTFRAADVEMNLGKLILERLHKNILWESMHGIIGQVDSGNKAAQVHKEKQMLEDKLSSIDKQLTRLTEFLLKGTISESQYSVQKERIDSEKSDVKHRMVEIDTLLQRRDISSQGLRSDVNRLQTQFQNVISKGQAGMFLVLKEAVKCLVQRIEIEFLPQPVIEGMSFDEIKIMYAQGRILPRHLNQAGWSDRKISKLLGKSGRRTAINYQIVITWKTGRQEKVYPFCLKIK